MTQPGQIHTHALSSADLKGGMGSVIPDSIAYEDPATLQQVGTREIKVTTVTYEKHLKLSARENKPAAEGRPPTDIWSVIVYVSQISHIGQIDHDDDLFDPI